MHVTQNRTVEKYLATACPQQFSIVFLTQKFASVGVGGFRERQFLFMVIRLLFWHFEQQETSDNAT